MVRALAVSRLSYTLKLQELQSSTTRLLAIQNNDVKLDGGSMKLIS